MSTYNNVIKIVSVLLYVTSILLSLLFVLMWASLSFMEDDIKHDVNWFIMIKNRFSEQHDFYACMKLVNLSVCLLYLVLSLWKGITGSRHGNSGNKVLAPTSITSKLCTKYMALTIIILIMNTSLVYLLRTVGHVVWEFFLITLPLSTVVVTSSILYPISIILIIFSSMIMYFHWKQISLHVFVMVHFILLVLTISVIALTSQACEACYTPTLPSRPLLTAHRGCPPEEPLENSIGSFQRAVSEYDTVITLESDVQISRDGMLFLLHDQYFVRTTSISDSCPHLDLYTPASQFFYNHSDNDCPIHSLRLKGNPEHAVGTFDGLLTIVKQSNRNVMFDITLPHHGHPFHEKMISLTLDSIVKSGIDQKKVWWSSSNMSSIRSKYPRLTLAAKSKFTSLQDFRQQKIKIANEQWNTSINTIRSLKEMGVMVNMYTISTKPLLDYAWCLGVESVTTNNCEQFNQQLENSLYEYCYSSWYTIGQYVVVLIISAPLLYIGYILAKAKQFREHCD